LDFLKTKGCFLDTELILRNLKIMADKGVKSIMFAGDGEPLLHKDISLIIKKAKELGFDISMTTNGILFNEEKAKEILPNLTWIRFSIDSGSSENYSKIHGTSIADFERLIKNIEFAVKLKKENNLKTTIGSQFLVLEDNKDQVFLLSDRLKKIGADNLQIKPCSKHPNSINSFDQDLKEFNRIGLELMNYDSENFKIFFRKETSKRIEEGICYMECYGLPFFALVDSMGNIIPCNLYYENQEYSYGNLYDRNFQEIWESEKRKDVLKKIKEKGISHCRRGCRLDPINRYIHRLKNPEYHDNFI
jgi:radical SAM protein with 4Fe4S-binding SPASM domain